MAVNELIGPRQATTPPHMCFFVLFQFTLGLRKKKKKKSTHFKKAHTQMAGGESMTPF